MLRLHLTEAASVGWYSVLTPQATLESYQKLGDEAWLPWAVVWGEAQDLQLMALHYLHPTFF